MKDWRDAIGKSKLKVKKIYPCYYCGAIGSDHYSQDCYNKSIKRRRKNV